MSNGTVCGLVLTAGLLLTGTLSAGVAQVNGTDYATLDAAMAALRNDGDELKVLADCTATVARTNSVAATIDLGGCTVRVAVTSNANAPWVVQDSDGGLLTVRNGTFRFDNQKCTGVAGVVSGGLVMEDIVCATDTKNASVTVAGGEAVIRRCSFLGDDRQASGVYVSGGTADVEDTTVKLKAGTDYWNVPVRVSGGARLTVSGGTYAAAPGGYALYVLSSGGKLTVNGGTFSGKIWNDNNYGAYKRTGTLILKDGTFTNVQFYDRSQPQYNVIRISGGTFDLNLGGSSYVNFNTHEVHDNGNGTWTVRIAGYDDYEALIGDTGYATLAQALAAVTSGGTVKLTKDCTMTGAFSRNVSCTVDFGGHTLIDGGVSGYAFSVAGSSALTLRNGAFVSSRTACDGLVTAGGSDLTLRNLAITTAGDSYAVQITGGCTGEIDGCTILNDHVAGVGVGAGTMSLFDTSVAVSTATWPDFSSVVYVMQGGVLNVDGSGNALTAPTGGRAIHVASSGGTVNFAGGNVSGGLYLDGSSSAQRGLCTIVGGTFNSLSFGVGAGGAAYNSYVVTGGTFSADPTAYVPDEVHYVVERTSPKSWSVREKTLSDSAATVTIGKTVLAYETLDEALAAANVDGCTLTLQRDGELTTPFVPTVSLTVDLNGKTLAASGFEGYAISLEYALGRELTITNGTFRSEDEFCDGLVMWGGASLEVRDVTVQTVGFNFAVLVMAGCAATVRGCDITTGCVPGIGVCGGSVDVYDTSVSLDFYDDYYSTPLAVQEQGVMHVWSGTFSAAAEACPFAYVWESGGTLDIRGGSFEGGVCLQADVSGKSYACMIRGGTFVDMAFGASSAVGRYEVTGGIFDADPTAYVPPTCSVVTEGEAPDQTWTVIGADVVAKVEGNSTIFFTSLDEALAVLDDYETLTVLRDATMRSTATLNSEYATVDFNGKTVNGSSVVGFAFDVTAPSVTLCDNVGGGGFVSTGTGCCGFVQVAEEDAFLTMIGLNVQNDGTDSAAVYVKGTSTGAFLCDCTIGGSARNYTPIYVNGGEIELENCTVTEGNARSSSYNAAALGISYNGKITVTGGSYTGYSYGAYVLASGGTLVMNGGTLAQLDTADGRALFVDHRSQGSAGTYCSAYVNGGTVAGGLGLSDNNTSRIYVSGGTFTDFAVAKQAAAAVLSITGGTFDADPGEWVADGYAAVRSGDLWVVDEVQGFPVSVKAGEHVTGGVFTIGGTAYAFGTPDVLANVGDEVVITSVFYALGYQPAGTYAKGCRTTVQTAVDWIVSAQTVPPGTGPTTFPADVTPVEAGITNAAFASAAPAEVKGVVTWNATHGAQGADANAARFSPKTVAGKDVSVAANDMAKAYLLDCAPTAGAIAAAESAFSAEIAMDAAGNPIVNVAGQEPGATTYGNGTLIEWGAADVVGPWSTDLAGARFFKFELVK